MKKKISILFTIVALLSLGIAVYAYSRTSDETKAKASCCAKSDSCPMKAKMGHDEKAGHDGKSCPMMAKKDGDAKAAGHNCCGCCGDSCPMKKEGEAKTSAVAASDSEKKCCDNCDCCKGKHEKTAV